MSKLVIFLFLGVCLMAVNMAFANDEVSDDENNAALEALVDSLKPQLQKELTEIDPKINFKKIWNKAKPILIGVGKVAAGAAITAVGK